VLIEEFILDNIHKLLTCVRNCNVTLRWLMLHNDTEVANLKQIVTSASNAEDILYLLLNISQFEFILKNIFETLLNSKVAAWDDCKSKSIKKMEELSDYFSGEKILSTENKNVQLQVWFKGISVQIKDLEFNDSTLAGRKIQQLIHALKEVEQFHQVPTTSLFYNYRLFCHFFSLLISPKNT
jgi:WASH complex subunit strumpellin